MSRDETLYNDANMAQTLRGQHGMALSHVSSGARILSEVRVDGNGQLSHDALRLSDYPYVPLPTLELLLNRLDAGVSRVSPNISRMVSQC